jgi:antitoxin (DNA-binding transcriptional repressor) of toxin-antitoxin stability system
LRSQELLTLKQTTKYCFTSCNFYGIFSTMKTITVREMKAHWSEVEKQVANGEIIEVLNHGKPRVRLVPAGGRQQVVWDDHLATAIPNKGVSVTETVARDRGGRW